MYEVSISLGLSWSFTRLEQPGCKIQPKKTNKDQSPVFGRLKIVNHDADGYPYISQDKNQREQGEKLHPVDFLFLAHLS
jgi:hypothetical protein